MGKFEWKINLYVVWRRLAVAVAKGVAQCLLRAYPGFEAGCEVAGAGARWPAARRLPMLRRTAASRAPQPAARPADQLMQNCIEVAVVRSGKE